MKDLEKIIQDLRAQVAMLEAESVGIAEERNEAVEAWAELKPYADKAVELEKKLRQAERQLKAQQENVAYKRKYEEISLKHSQSEKQLKDAMHRISAASEQLAETRKDYGRSQQDVRDLTEDARRLTVSLREEADWRVKLAKENDNLVIWRFFGILFIIMTVVTAVYLIIAPLIGGEAAEPVRKGATKISPGDSIFTRCEPDVWSYVSYFWLGLSSFGSLIAGFVIGWVKGRFF